MEEMYPKEMNKVQNNEYKTTLTFHYGKENKLSQMIIYHIFEGLDLVYNKFNTYISPEASGEIKKEYSPEELLEKKGTFFNMVKIQTESSNWELN